MVVDEFFLVLADPPIELVDEAVYGGVHIFLCRFGKYRTAVYSYFCFRFVSQFLDREDAVHVQYDIKMTFQFFYFRLYVISK